ncbi:S24 family peptidase [Methylobacterium nonmethylotrophicum]|uniref:Uncharacterized protein n=1 Tax=Methylobacterium nonmethylotrophicum TaxID=1141884 RepID=A0A4Z0NQM3_9HYPH|nr:S24 family peptidase [Methylobacterium nonmethylotrophicum]TGD98080.1 hypothetical protein EU555_18205 [Methylobacterium nonmethylotrophicum]
MIREELHGALEAAEEEISTTRDDVELVGVLEQAPADGGTLQAERAAVQVRQPEDVLSAIHAKGSDLTSARSVKIPGKSMAFLPVSRLNRSGQITAMELADILSRIDRRLQALGISEHAAGIAAGKPDAIRNLRRAIEKDGRQGMSTATLNALAPVLRTTPVWLFAGVGREDLDATVGNKPSSLAPVEEIVSVDQRSVRVLYGGFVEAGSFREISEFTDVDPEEIYLPPNKDHPRVQQVAFDVKGDSMNDLKPRPILPGDRVIALDYEGLGGRVALHTGMIVVVQQSLEGGHLVERSIKQLEVYEDRYEFHPRSSVKRYKPIIVKHDMEADDGRGVRILAWARNVLNSL